MPLGFGKSVLTTAAASAGGTGFRAFTGSGEPNSGNMASFKFTGLGDTFDTDHKMTIVMWFRAKSDLSWLDGATSASSTSGHSHFFKMVHSGSGTSSSVFPKWIRLSFTQGSFGWQWQLLDSGNSYMDGRGYGNVQAQQTHSFDGGWKCIMASQFTQYDPDSDGDFDEHTNDPAGRSMYVGDTNYTNLPEGFDNAPVDVSDLTSGHLRYAAASAGSNNYNAGNEVGSGFHMGPIWIYNDYFDFRQQSIRRRFFNPSNTDGFVTPGTDGTTSSGATQPDLFLYHNGTTLVNGGSDSITISQTSIGSGSITAIADTDGPGSGGTI